MTCYTAAAMLYLIATLGVPAEVNGLMILLQETPPRLYVWRGAEYCAGGVAV